MEFPTPTENADFNTNTSEEEQETNQQQTLDFPGMEFFLEPTPLPKIMPGTEFFLEPTSIDEIPFMREPTFQVSAEPSAFDATITSDRSASEYKNTGAFAVLKNDGSIVSWGKNIPDPQDVNNKLANENFKHVYSNNQAFAGIKQDGSVISWGKQKSGGNSADVDDELTKGVQSIASTKRAFTALREDGFITSWGNTNHGGKLNFSFDEISGRIQQVFSTNSAFAAIDRNGKVFSWDNNDRGGDSTDFAKQLRKNAQTVASTSSAFAALKQNGNVIAWGDPKQGGDVSEVKNLKKGTISHIFANNKAFAALKTDGSVVAWGDTKNGGDITGVAEQLKDSVRQIYATDHAFAALKSDGSLVTWGNPNRGGQIENKQLKKLTAPIIKIVATNSAFAALLSDGSVVAWGDVNGGGDSSKIAKKLKHDVVEIKATNSAFAVIKRDGSVVSWGDEKAGGDSSEARKRLNKGVLDIVGSGSAFAALKNDGSVVSWGDPEMGGDPNVRSERLQSDVVALSTPFDPRNLPASYQAFTTTENIGNTHLLKDSSKLGFAQSASGGQSFSVTFNGQQVGDNTWSGWTIRGAENINGTNSGAWLHSSGKMEVWNLDGNWSFISTTLIQPGSSSYYQAEVDFKQDFNGDGTIGSPNPQLVYEEQVGNTYLLKDSSKLGFAQSASGGQSFSVTFNGQQVGDNTWSGWTIRGAENINGTNSGAWLHSSGKMEVWNLDDNWSFISTTLIQPGSSSYYQAETDFSQDFNGDGTIGSPNPQLVYEEQVGNTYLLKDSSKLGFAQSASGGQSFSVTFNGQQVGDNTWSGWTIRGAENINGTNSGAWLHSSGKMEVWNLDGNWSFISTTLIQPGSSSYYQAETDFSQDFNGDGTIGSPNPQLVYEEQVGNTYLLKDSSKLGFAQSASGGQSFSVTFNGQQVGDNTWSGWTIRGAENINGTNSGAWLHSSGKMEVWNLDGNWSFISTTLIQPGSSSYYQAETDFKPRLQR